ncbi:P-II family nitrogen regulator [Thiomicrorhabdus sp. ZW0627]|uniref:P-II family nitrogen regulator n=1 Tax=Thiomicrorhabdus sp. ZW0627 TaxID=3039774 RepID=UPI002436D846|nr:P-II family nitrogen regulator [Thiomicrorhabdus sp. ZW0627]MDG6774347.1 P-II family nitrogen regulator [Thiomicrorhabdus sp. ZW0627]
MNLIKAIINPYKLDDVRDALSELGTYGLTAIEVKGYGRQKGQKEIYRGAEYEISYVPKIMIEVAVSDDALEKVVTCIAETARTGKIGDGKIFVLPLEQVIRVRTSETGEEAL